jgi:hypothetical protein
VAGGDDRRCVLCCLWPAQTQFYACSTVCVDGAQNDWNLRHPSHSWRETHQGEFKHRGHITDICCNREPAYRIWYNDWIHAGRPKGRTSSPCRGKNFHFSTLSRSALGPTQPPIQWVPGAFSPGLKRLGREADHSPPASADVKITWMYISTPTYVFIV